VVGKFIPDLCNIFPFLCKVFSRVFGAFGQRIDAFQRVMAPFSLAQFLRLSSRTADTGRNKRKHERRSLRLRRRCARPLVGKASRGLFTSAAGVGRSGGVLVSQKQALCQITEAVPGQSRRSAAGLGLPRTCCARASLGSSRPSFRSPEPSPL
jgi:hypothetical protein